MASIDSRNLAAARAQLATVGTRYRDAAGDIMADGARTIQAGMKVDATGHRHLKDLPGTVGRSRLSTLHWEIGFNRRGQGNLAHIIVFGSVNNAPVYDDTGPLHRWVPQGERRLADKAEQLVADCF